MQQHDLAALFERFRSRGDTDALGRAFDACAPELLRVARRLGNSREDAEDLVQASFLTAIEKTATHERGRSPLPWMVGILVLHARNLRRKRGRTSELPTLVDGDSPDAAAERAELLERVAAAVRELPPHYSQVLAPYLHGEFGAERIALLTGRAPGTVRMQIHRGLQRLRRALGGGLFAWTIEPLRLRRLRADTLARACRARGLPTPAAPLMAGPIALVAAFAALLAGAAWIAVESASSSVTDTATAPATLEMSEPLAEVNYAATAALATARAEAVSSGGDAGVEALRGVRGRLVDAQGAPLAKLDVRLLAFDLDLSAPKLPDERDAPPNVERSRDTTGPDGRFVLPGGRRGELLLLAIDSGGPRGHARGVEGSPASDGELDLGDVPLAKRAELVGRVVDDAGAPLASVRVRVALPGRLGAVSLVEAAVASRLEDRWSVVAPAPWLRTSLEELPTPTVLSDESGAFRIAAPKGEVQLQFTAHGFAPRDLREQAAVGATRELGDVVLARGRSLVGRVVDADGAPISGVEVCVGVCAPAASFAQLRSAGLSSLDGTFKCDGLATAGVVVVAARRSAKMAWTCAEFATLQALELRLPRERELRVVVRSSTGEPLDDVEVELNATTQNGAALSALAEQALQTRRGNSPIVFDALAPGSYLATARRRGFASVRAPVEVRDESAEFAISLDAAVEYDVRIVQAADARPIAGARVTLRSDSRRVVARALSGADGVAQLALPAGLAAHDLRCDVWHHEFAPLYNVPVEYGARSQEFTLDEGGSVRVQVLERGAPAKRPWIANVAVGDLGVWSLSARTKADGVATIDRLAAGRWLLDLHEPLASDAGIETWLASVEGDATPQRMVSVGIDPGERTELTIEVDPSFPPANSGRARLHGRVTLAAGAHEGLALSLAGRGASAQRFREVRLDAEGGFDFGWIEPGSYSAQLRFLRLRDEDSNFTPWIRRIELAAGEARRLEIALQRCVIEVRVLDVAGKPVANVPCELRDSEQRQVGFGTLETDSEGRVTVAVYQAGAFSASAEHATHGYCAGECVVSKGASLVTCELRLDRGVVCAGTVGVPDELLVGVPAEDRVVNLHVRGVDETVGRVRSIAARVDAEGRARFEVVGLKPGRYRVALDCKTRATPVELELGAEGNTQLRLDFEAEKP
ncbi:MAG: sigma-70 family RNA polymerase sigma factor [Planctomycetes bacterium]|nr:sigma-70 family RNA polymerase sigma factor [Planctomycetota bacterium]